MSVKKNISKTDADFVDWLLDNYITPLLRKTLHYFLLHDL